MRLRVGLAAASALAAVAGVGWTVRARASRTPLPAPPGHLVGLAGEAIHYLDEGSGEPLVLVHGLGGSTASWRFLMPLLADTHRVIAIDLAGYGFSTRAPVWPLSHEHQAQRVVRLMDELGLERVTLIGLSLGGAISQRIAIRWPDRVKALVLISSVDASEPPAQRIQEGLRRMGLGSPWAVAAVVPLLSSRRLVRTGVRTALRRAVADPVDVTEEWVDVHSTPLLLPGTWPTLARLVSDITIDEPVDLGQIAQPALVLTGDIDRVLPGDVSGAIASAIRGARYVQLEGVGHLPPLETPDRVRREIRAFLETLPAKDDAAGS